MEGGATTVEVDTTSNVRDSVLASKGIDTSDTFDVTQELCFNLVKFIRLR